MAIVVSGGTRGIGLEIAAHLAGQGGTAVLGYRRDHDQARGARSRLEAGGSRAITVASDLGTLRGAQELVDGIPDDESVDHLVHCAVMVVGGASLDTDPVEFEHAVAVNGMALHHLVRASSKRLVRGSHVLMLTSRGARAVGPHGYAAIGLGKALAEAAVRYLAVELAPRGIRVNALAVGMLDTAAVRALFQDDTEQRLAASAEKTPTGRGIRHEDYLPAIDYLASSGAEMVTGQTIAVYGGSDLLA